ncbi:MAG: UDP-N-acetylmuramoylalanyl-D-glutamate--2,6-diaminopimelate ligase, partial [Spirochaetaceae bacterium]|nr:UDP-N-acetylmuramoylalanyl-D-glutamate--2,6-diaminopimelate ligase [Spirochaetaceae bacterium]
LGAESEAEHSRVGTLIAQKKADLVIFIGNEMRYAFESAKKSAPNANLLYFAGKDDGIIAEAAAAIKNFANDGDLILLKASRGIGLERLTKLLTGS